MRTFARAGGVAGNGAFIPFQSEPAHALQDDIHSRLGVPRRVGVFNSQHKRRAAMARVEPVEQGRSRTANMQITRWTRSKADPDVHGCKVTVFEKGLVRGGAVLSEEDSDAWSRKNCGASLAGASKE